MVDQLTGYYLFYSSCQLFYVLVYADAFAAANFCLSVAACAIPSDLRWSLAAHCGYVARAAWLMPYLFNSNIWQMICDTGFVLVTLTFAARRGFKWHVDSADRDALLRKAAAVVSNAIVWFYLGAGVWKINWGFLDTQGSCAPIYILQLLDYYLLPTGTMPPVWLTRLLGVTAPAVVIAVETCLGVLLHLPGVWRLLGVALGILLHALIALTPGPNNAGGFGVMLLARYCFFVPAAAAAALTELRLLRGPLFALALAIVVSSSLPALLRGADHVFFVDWSLPVYTAQALVLGRALAIGCRCRVAAENTAVARGARTNSTGSPHAARADSSRRSSSSAPRAAPRAALQATPPPQLAGGAQKALRCGFAAWMVWYTFGLPILGLQDMGNVHMFASLRLHGGSNHLFLPTGLLQEWLVNDEPSSPWSGGVVRVESATSPTMRNLYPAEVTHILSPRTRELLRTIGHTGRRPPSWIGQTITIHGTVMML